MTRPDHTIVLSFPSLAHLVASPSSARASHLDAVHSAAQQTSDALLVIVRTPPDAPSPWSPAPSSSTSTRPTSPPPTLLAPSALFLPLEQSLARIYNAATTAFFAHPDGQGPLKQVDVVVEQMRDGVARLCTDPDTAVSTWDYSRDGDQGTDDKGKAKATAPGDPSPSTTPTGDDTKLPPTYPVVALGGTFDHLHAGHKILLTMAASLCTSRLVVGVSDDHLLVNKKFKHRLQPIDERMRAVRRFVELVRPSVECDAVPLQDVYGPTANDPTIEALVVSDETRAGGDSINSLRAERSLSQLEVFTISLVGGEDAQRHGAEVEVEVATKMGSTGIREWLDRRERAREGAQEEQAGQRGGEGEAGGEAAP